MIRREVHAVFSSGYLFDLWRVFRCICIFEVTRGHVIILSSALRELKLTLDDDLVVYFASARHASPQVKCFMINDQEW